MKAFFAASLLLPLVVLSGCQRATSTGGVAIIDLDKIATAMGWLDEISRSLQAADGELRGQLSEVLRGTINSIEEAKKQVAAEARLTAEQVKILTSAKDPQELGALPLTKEQRDKLVEAVDRANVAWRTALNNSQQALQGRRANLILGCRERIRPAARRVAEAQGISVVLVTSDNVLYADPKAADITEKVIDDLQRTMPGEKGRVAAPSPAPPPSAATPPSPAPAPSAAPAPASSRPESK